MAIQEVFERETRRGVLVLRPRGDAVGFSDQQITRDLESILDHLDQQDTPRVAVQLNRARYFGSVMIGTFASIHARAKSRSGRFAICEASDEMLEALRALGFGDRWAHYPTLKEAIVALNEEE